MRRVFPAMCVLLLACVASAFAQTGGSVSGTAVQAASVMPRLVKYNGTLLNAQGPVAVTFALYTDQTGDMPVWQEVQQVAPDANGRYAVYLGASTADGLPLDLFASGQARWLGAQVSGQAELPRVMLVSVPYALAAGDAQTLGGKPASAYLQAASDLAAAGGATAGYMRPATMSSASLAGTNSFASDGVSVQFTDASGTMTGYSVQNLAAGASAYSGMLFFDQTGNLAQFQGFNNSTHEYRINNIAKNVSAVYDGSINFMVGNASKFKVDSAGIRAPVLMRLGSETGTSEAPTAGILTRRINTRALAAGKVVARTDYSTLERDGTFGGFRIAATGYQDVSCMGINAAGASVNKVLTVNPGTTAVYADAENMVYFQCSFGDPFASYAWHGTQITLQRRPGDYWWLGVVTSTVNQ